MADTKLTIVTESGQPAGAAAAGAVPAGAMPTGGKQGVAGVFTEALGDSLRDFGSNLTASITATLAGSLVGRATGSFTAAGAVSTLVGQTVRNIQARAQRDKEFAALDPEEQLIQAREQSEGRKLSAFEKLIAKGEVSADPSIARKEAEAAGLVGKEASGAAAAAAKILPVMGALLAAGLVASEAFQFVNKGLKDLGESLAPFSGEIQSAEATVQIRAIEGRIRRAEEFGPALAGLVETRGRFEESFEGFKARILIQALPVIENLLQIGTDILDKLPGADPAPTGTDFIGRTFDQLVARNQGVVAQTRQILGRGGL